MNVRVALLFDLPTGDDEIAVRSMARNLTNDPASIRVFAREGASDWVVAECTMETGSKKEAVVAIDRLIHQRLWRCQDSIISFPKNREAVLQE